MRSTNLYLFKQTNAISEEKEKLKYIPDFRKKKNERGNVCVGKTKKTEDQQCRFVDTRKCQNN